jgi:hypothetical protein
MDTNSINYKLIERIRAMAIGGRTATEIANEIALSQNLETKSCRVSIVIYMQKAFLIPLPVLAQFGAWNIFKDGSMDDDEINQIFIPEILSRKEKWCCLPLIHPRLDRMKIEL